jgi:hypothetical protein
MSKNLLIIFFLLLFFDSGLEAQNITINSTINGFRHNWDCCNDGAGFDCSTFANRPDPRYRVWVGFDGANFQQSTSGPGIFPGCGSPHFTYGADGVHCTQWNPGSIPLPVLTGNATIYNVDMQSWEDDGCGSDCVADANSSNPFNACFYNADDVRCGRLRIGDINLCNQSPCQNTTYTGAFQSGSFLSMHNRCNDRNGAGYGIDQLVLNWSFAVNPTITLQPNDVSLGGTNRSTCENIDLPLEFHVNDKCGWTLARWVRWEQSSDGGSTWTAIAGSDNSTAYTTQTIFTYSPPLPDAPIGGSTIIRYRAVMSSACAKPTNDTEWRTGTFASISNVVVVTVYDPANVFCTAPSCNIVYVDPVNGNDITGNGSPVAPFRTISHAAASNPTYIRVAVCASGCQDGGVVHIPNNCVIEGGYFRSGSSGEIWVKYSNNVTNITFSGQENAPGGDNTIRHIAAFKSDNKSGWAVKDINITTGNAPANTFANDGRGMSNYGFLVINNSSNYTISRVNINVGSAGPGNGGSALKPANASNGNAGGNGAQGHCDNNNENACPGSGVCGGAGGSLVGSGVRQGGAGGAGGRGSANNSDNNVAGSNGSNGGGGAAGATGGGASGANGGCGTDCNRDGRKGNDGANGANGSNASQTPPAAPNSFGVYFQPSGNSASGNPGAGGGGGKGGGGGGRQSGSVCDDGPGSGGGGGGSGGQGGLGGPGGLGGGGCFGIYRHNSLTGSSISQVNISVSQAAQGGAGGEGGDGGDGGRGGCGAGGNNCSTSGGNSLCNNGGHCGTGRVCGNCEVGAGGQGGRGGNGGKGGTGQPGALGRSDHMITDTGSPPNTNPSQSITNPTNVTVDFATKRNNITGRACINSEIDLMAQSLSSGNWSFSGLGFVDTTSFGPSYLPNETIIKVTTNSSGYYNLGANGGTLQNFLYVVPDSRTLPVIIPASPTVLEFCDGASQTFTVSNSYDPSNIQQREWRLFKRSGTDGQTLTYVDGSNTSAFSYTFTSSDKDSFLVRYRERHNCCGWSRPVFKYVRVAQRPNPNIAVDLAGCVTPSGAYAELTGTDLNSISGTSLVWQKLSGAGTISPTNTPTTQIAGMTSGVLTQVQLSMTYDVCTQSVIEDILPPALNLNVVSKYSNDPFCKLCELKDGNTYRYFDLNGHIIAEITDESAPGSTLDLSNTSVCVDLYYDPEVGPVMDSIPMVPTAVYFAQPFLPRRWAIKPTNKADDGKLMATVKLYFTKDEVDSLREKSMNTAFSFNNPLTELYVSKYVDNNNYPVNNFSNPSATGSLARFVPSLVQAYGSDYVVTFHVDSFSTFYVHANRFFEAPLPVELVSFTATPLSGSIMLDWNTLSELNNEKFEIERSTNGIIFNKIGEVPGNGTTIIPIHYQFEDVDVVPGVLYYYRLRQIDFEGSEKLSNIVSAVIQPLNGFVLGLFVPNPAKNVSSIRVQTDKESRIGFLLYTIDGRQLMSRDFNVDKGVSILVFDFSNLPSGTYIGMFFTTDGRQIRKLVKIE